MSYKEYKEIVHKNTLAFDASKASNAINEWLDDYILKSGMKKAVLGISGGKDSTVVSKILVNKLGKENVIGLLMPNGTQKDISDSYAVVDLLGIEHYEINIENAYKAIIESLGEVSKDAAVNIAPRIRMTTLYTFGQTHNCRVAGTGNLSELILGYFTKFGDGAHDFNIIANFTSLEVMRLGEELGLPDNLVYKTPDDGLSGMSDEEKLGISYVDVHTYLRKDRSLLTKEVIEKISKMERNTYHKREKEPTPDYRYSLIDLPELYHSVMIEVDNCEYCATLIESKMYLEGVVFQTVEGKEIRINKIRSYKYMAKTHMLACGM